MDDLQKSFIFDLMQNKDLYIHSHLHHGGSHRQ